MRRAIPTVLAALSVLLLPASASATTKWFYNHQPIARGETVEVGGYGERIMVSLKAPRQLATKVPCEVEGTEAFRNTAMGGVDETRSISFEWAEETTVTPTLPWTSTLLESSEMPLHDEWENVAVHLVYQGVDYGTFTGTLDTTVGDVDPQHEIETLRKDEPDSYVTFRGVSQISLNGPNGYKMWLVGGYHFGGKEERITDETGSWAQTVSLKAWPNDPYVILGAARKWSKATVDADAA